MNCKIYTKYSKEDNRQTDTLIHVSTIAKQDNPQIHLSNVAIKGKQ